MVMIDGRWKPKQNLKYDVDPCLPEKVIPSDNMGDAKQSIIPSAGYMIGRFSCHPSQ